MTFTVKDWHDSPTTDTPISAAALEDMESRLSAYTDAQVAGGSGGFQSIAFASSITPDVAAGSTVSVGSLTGNITINAPTNPVAGKSLKFIFAQDSTGGRTITWNSVFDLPSWNANTDYPTGPNKVTSIEFVYDGSKWKMIATSAITRPWFINVCDFGAVADWNGTTGTDNAAAIQKAIDSFWPNTSGHGSTWKKGVIFFPTGATSYLVNSTINVDAGNVGSTPAITFLSYGATLYTTTASDLPVWNLTDAQASALSIGFHGLHFYVNCVRNSHRLSNCEYTRFSNCRWSGGGSQAVHMVQGSGNSTGNIFDNCQFDNLDRAFLLQGGQWTQITNCQFQEGVGINWLDVPPRMNLFTITGASSTNTFTCTTPHGLFRGQVIQFSSLTGGSSIAANTTYYVSNHTSTTFQITSTLGGSVLALGSDVTACTVYPQGSTAWLRFEGNEVYGQGGTLPVIRLRQGDANAVTGNTFTNCTQDAIELGYQGWQRGASVVGNTFIDNHRSDVRYLGGLATNISANVHCRRFYQKWNVTVTMTIATPGVITRSNHGLVADQPVRFSTSGALPTGLTAGTTYYVRNPATNTFEVSATAGGASIATSGSQSGTHTLLSGYSVIYMPNDVGGSATAGNGAVVSNNTFEDDLSNSIPKVPYAIECDTHFTKMTVVGNATVLPINVAGANNTVGFNGYSGERLNVRSFGATGNGVTDDTAAFTRAVTACSTNGGGVIYVPAGTYLITSAISIPNFVCIEGDGQSSLISVTGNIFAFNLNPANRARFSNIMVQAVSTQTSGGAFDFTNCGQNIYFDHIYIGNNIYTGFNLAPTGGTRSLFHFDYIRWNGVTGCTNGFIIGDGTNLVTDVYMRDIHGTAASISDMAASWITCRKGTDTVQIEMSLFYSGSKGATIGATGTGDCTNFKWTSTTFDNQDLQGIDIQSCRGFTLSNVNVQGCGTTALPGVDIGTAAKQVTWEGGDVHENRSDGVLIRNGSQDTNITGASIRNNNSSNQTFGSGISVSAGASDWSVVGCAIGNRSGTITANQKYGILVGSGASDHVLVTGNRFAGNVTQAYLNSGVTGVNVRWWNNDGDIVNTKAAASTVTLPPGDIITISGTAAIDTITASYVGRRVCLIFTGTASGSGVIDASNLKIAGSFAYTPDDTMELMCDGTNWYECGRSAN